MFYVPMTGSLLQTDLQLYIITHIWQVWCASFQFCTGNSVFSWKRIWSNNSPHPGECLISGCVDLSGKETPNLLCGRWCCPCRSCAPHLCHWLASCTCGGKGDTIRQCEQDSFVLCLNGLLYVTMDSVKRELICGTDVNYIFGPKTWTCPL